MSSHESHFSFTTKVNGDLLTVRGETAEEFAYNAEALAEVLPSIAALQVAAQGGAGQGTAVTNAVAGAGAAVVSDTGAIATEKDKYNNEWTYNLPNAPALPDGRGKYALKSGTSKAGRAYTAWVDPALGPKDFPKGASEAPIIWPDKK